MTHASDFEWAHIVPVSTQENVTNCPVSITFFAISYLWFRVTIESRLRGASDTTNDHEDLGTINGVDNGKLVSPHLSLGKRVGTADLSHDLYSLRFTNERILASKLYHRRTETCAILRDISKKVLPFSS
jgi:hypothetical protein